MKLSFLFTILVACDQVMQPSMMSAEKSTPRLRSSRVLVTRATNNNNTTSYILPEGIWTSRGYGYTIRAKDNEMELFHETKNSCIKEGTTYVYDNIQQVVVDDSNVATVALHGSIAPIKFDRTDNFQRGCANGMTPIVEDTDYERSSLTDFDILAETFAEHYAFFEQRNIDWSESTSTVRATLHSNSSDEELQQAFISILGPLDDAHVAIMSDDGSFQFSPKILPVYEALAQEFSHQNEFEDVGYYFWDQLMKWLDIVSTYMDDDGLNGIPDPDSVLWGRYRDGNVGYMQMFGFEPKDSAAFTESLNTAFRALKDTDAIVVDIRINGGGSDTYALEVASHFASVRTHVLSKRAVHGEGYTDLYRVYLEPSDPALIYDGEVVVIASESTGSAAEIFIMAMKQLSRTVLLGRPTAGALSDILPKRLPNNWEFGLSNEEYLTPEGTLYEIVGVPPDLRPEADLLPLSEREAFIDTWLEEAFDHATREQE